MLDKPEVTQPSQPATKPKVLVGEKDLSTYDGFPLQGDIINFDSVTKKH